LAFTATTVYHASDVTWSTAGVIKIMIKYSLVIATLIVNFSYNIAYSDDFSGVLCELDPNLSSSDCSPIDFVLDLSQQEGIVVCPQNKSKFNNDKRHRYASEVSEKNSNFCSSLPKSNDDEANIWLRGFSRGFRKNSGNCISEELCNDLVYASLVKHYDPGGSSAPVCMLQFKNGLYGYAMCEKKIKAESGFYFRFKSADVNPYVNFEKQLGRALYDGSDYKIVGFIHQGNIFPANDTVQFEDECMDYFDQESPRYAQNYLKPIGFGKNEFDPKKAISIYAPSENPKITNRRVCPWVFGGREGGLCSPENFFKKNIYDVNIQDFIRDRPKTFDRYLTFSSENGECYDVEFEVDWDSFEENGFIRIGYEVNLPFVNVSIYDVYFISSGANNLTSHRWYEFYTPWYEYDSELKELQFKFINSEKRIKKFKIPSFDWDRDADWYRMQNAQELFATLSKIYMDSCAKGFIVRKTFYSGEKKDTLVSGCEQQTVLSLKEFEWLNEGLSFANVQVP